MTGDLLRGPTGRRVALVASTLACAAVVGAAAVGGWAYDRHVHRELRAQAEGELATLAQIRAQHIAAWREERRDDAAVFASSPSVRSLVSGDVSVGEHARDHLGQAARQYGYLNIAVLLPTGAVALALRGAPALDDDDWALLRRAVAAGEPVISEIEPNPDGGAPMIEVAAPVLGGGGAVLLLRVDPSRGLFPDIDRIARAGRVAETLLVHRGDGLAIVFASAGNKLPPRTSRVRLEEVARTEVQAALGRTGAFEGKDDRAAPTLAFASPVPGSSWTVVAQMGVAEALASAGRLRALLLLAVLGVIAAGAALVLVLRQRQRLREIAARQRAEEALRESEERLKSVLDATEAGIFDFDLITGRSNVGSAWAKVYGYTAREIPDLAAGLSLAHPDDLPRVREALEAHVAGKTQLCETEHRVRSASGEWRWIHARGKVIERDASSRPRRIAGTVVDVTERYRMREQLLLADRMASLGTLAAGMAHEINNPLSYVTANLACVSEDLKSLVELALAGRRDDLEPLGRDLGEALAAAREGAERVRVIVRDLKAFTRSEDEIPGPVDLAAVVHSSIRMAKHELAERARVVAEVDGAPPVLGNAARIGQIVLNLLVNAAHSIEAGVPERNEVRVSARADGTERVALEVRDTGSGIAPEVLPRIFDPFFTTKQPGQGTGLGLTICHGIVASMRGEIRVDSERGRGTSFTVLLPRAVDDQAKSSTGTSALA